MESWVTSYHENESGPATTPKGTNDLSLRLIKARARTLVWDMMEMKNEILYPHPGRKNRKRCCFAMVF